MSKAPIPVPLGNQPAYPTVDVDIYEEYAGLTKRELFAAMAMQGFVINADIVTKQDSKDLATRSVYFADLLLMELSK